MFKSNKKVYLFTPGDKEFSSLSENEKSYILWGEEKGYNKNYKCRIRPKWYHVQQSWCGDAFFIRHIYLYPRIVLNEKKALVTDTLHKIRFLNYA